MKTFKINNELEVVCEWKKTRNAFKHEATILRNGREIDTVKICYLNRTWERYEFESVLHKLCESKSNGLTTEERAIFSERIKNSWREDDAKETARAFGSIAMIAKMGDVLHAGDQKSANDWKTRMLKAGLQGKGLQIPEDWDGLSESEKSRRLDNVIAELTK